LIPKFAIQGACLTLCKCSIHSITPTIPKLKEESEPDANCVMRVPTMRAEKLRDVIRREGRRGQESGETGPLHRRATTPSLRGRQQHAVTIPTTTKRQQQLCHFNVALRPCVSSFFSFFNVPMAAVDSTCCLRTHGCVFIARVTVRDPGMSSLHTELLIVVIFGSRG
jgi:hypothetical protein